MGNKNELLQKIEDGYQKFSKGQKKLADFIREDYDKAAFLTAAKMGGRGRRQRVYGSPVCHGSGVRRISRVPAGSEELVRTKLNSIQRMEVTYGRTARERSWRRCCSRTSRRSS